MRTPDDDSLDLLRQWCHHLRLPPLPEDTAIRTEILARSFAHLPYENLGKVAKHAQLGRIVLPTPRETLEAHWRFGAGGTCFSLTDALITLLQAAGIEATPLLADRSYGPDTHCAVLVLAEATPHIIDPGYLIFRPLPLLETAVVMQQTLQDVELTPLGNRRWELATRDTKSRKRRLIYKGEAVDQASFRLAWEKSYGWEMMTYPVISQHQDQQQYFIRDRWWQTRTRDQIARVELSAAEMIDQLVRQFGFDRSYVEAAWKHFPSRSRSPS